MIAYARTTAGWGHGIGWMAPRPGGALARSVMPERVYEGDCPVTHTAGVIVRRRDRAHQRERWAAGRSNAARLAELLGVSPSRARHFRTDDPSGPITTFYAMVADPGVDGGALVAGALEAFYERFQTMGRSALQERLAFLSDNDVFRRMAAWTQATVRRTPDRHDLGRDLAACLLEMAALEELLA